MARRKEPLEYLWRSGETEGDPVPHRVLKITRCYIRCLAEPGLDVPAVEDPCEAYTTFAVDRRDMRGNLPGTGYYTKFFTTPSAVLKYEEEDPRLSVGEFSEFIRVGKWATVLGVTAPYTAESIRSAYRRAAKLHHPDRGGEASDFRRVEAAYRQAMRSVGEEVRMEQ